MTRINATRAAGHRSATAHNTYHLMNFVRNLTQDKLEQPVPESRTEWNARGVDNGECNSEPLILRFHFQKA